MSITTIGISVPSFVGTLSFDRKVALEDGRAGKHMLPPGAVSGFAWIDYQSDQYRVPYRQPFPFVDFTVRLDGPFVEEAGLECD